VLIIATVLPYLGFPIQLFLISLVVELQIILEGIYKLMDKKGDVTKMDIKKVFGNLQIFGKKLADWWIESPNFINKLNTWN